MNTGSARQAIPAAAMAAAALLCWRGVLWGGDLPLFGNFLFFFHPLIHRATEQAVTGSLPLWNPNAFCGIPLAADPQAGVFSPLHLPFRLFGFAPGYRLQLAGWVLLAAFFTYCLARRLGLRRGGAALSGFLAAANGFAFHHSGLVSHMGSMVFLPAVLLFWVSGRGLLSGTALALQYLGGHPFFVYMTIIACLFLRPPRPLRTAAVAAVPAAALSAVQLWPALELFSASVRQGALDTASLFVYSLPPDSLWTMAAQPWWNRNPANFTGDPTITSFYLGLPAVGAALFAALFLRRCRALALLGCLSLWMMLGNHSPLYPLLLKSLPGLGLFRFPAQWGWLATVAGALLAGFGAQSLRSPWKAALAAAVACDLWVFMAVPATARVRPDFLSLRPATLSPSRIGEGPRVAHTDAFMEAQAAAEPGGDEASWHAQKASLVPSHATVFGVREVQSYNIYRPRRSERLLKGALSRDTRAEGLLRFLGVSALIDGDGSGRFEIRRVDSPLARLTWASRARAIPFPESASYLAGPQFAPPGEVVLEAVSGEQGGRGRVAIVDEGPTRLVAVAESDGSGYLVWADSFYPGWRAFLDGRRVPILAANGAFRAIAVPAGRHEAAFAYLPPPFFAGLMAALLGLAFLAAAGACALP